jgi:hypothetical protein
MDKETKVYRLMGIDTAMHLLRPDAAWEISNNQFTRWEDERPCPTIEEVYETIDKIKAFEDSINTIFTEKQKEEMGLKRKQVEEALGDN